MADPVKGENVVFYAKLGTAYYPFACAKDVTITQTTDKIELAPYTTGKWRSYIYGRTSGTITGNGVIKVDAGVGKYSIFDLLNFQTDHIIVLTRYSVTDPQGNQKSYDVPCLIDEVSVSGSVGQFATYSFTLTMSGDPSFNQTPVNDALTDIDSYDYTATGGESTISNAVLIGVDVLDVRRNGIGLQVITVGTPNGSQCKFDASTGQIEFGMSLGAGEYILVIYVS